MQDDDLKVAATSIACTALVTRLYAALDQHAYEALDSVFAEDAAWLRLGQRTVGLPAIRTLMQQRSPTLATCHVITNPLVHLTGPNDAEGSFCMLVVRQQGVPEGATRPLQVEGPWRLSTLHTRFVRTAGGWRIAEQRTEPLFEFVTSASGVAA